MTAKKDDKRYRHRLQVRVEWPTIILIGIATLGVIALVLQGGHWLTVMASYGSWVGVLGSVVMTLVLTLLLVLHSSLQHEVLHGHPTRYPRFNEALVWVPFGWLVPYGRFRDLHLAHHQDERLTDPFDDPESNYWCPDVWRSLPRWQQRLLIMNNTLLGRMLLGPVLSMGYFYRSDWRRAQKGDASVIRSWCIWAALMTAWLAVWLTWGSLPLLIYAFSCYLALSVLSIRTFLEHRAHESTGARTAIVEDRGLLAFLFLNNNLHVVHHRHPKTPWYRLPARYRSAQSFYQALNQHYVYRNYAQVFRRYLLTCKDSVPHPLKRIESPGA